MAANHLCGCGRAFAECHFWNAVITDVSVAHPDLDAAGIGARTDARLRVRMVPAMYFRRARGLSEVPHHPDDAVIASLYHALSTQPGAEHAIVDSSKLPPYARLVGRLPRVDMYVIHVVRDPRATAFSWGRAKATRDTADNATMPRLSIMRSSIIWLLWNLIVVWWWPPERRLTIRYEDFVDQPAREMARIAHALGSYVPDSLVAGSELHLAPTHSVAGNPDRLDAGIVRLRRDDEWRSAMPAFKRWVCTVLCLPGLRKFGYGLRP